MFLKGNRYLQNEWNRIGFGGWITEDMKQGSSVLSNGLSISWNNFRNFKLRIVCGYLRSVLRNRKSSFYSSFFISW